MLKICWFKFLKTLAMLAGVVLAADILLITGEVVFRNLGLSGLGWASDVIEFSLPLATLLVAPWLVAQKGHVKLDLLVERMASGQRNALYRATMLLATVVTGVLVYASTLLALDTHSSGSLVMKSLVFPEWWVMAPVPLLFLLIAIECLRSALAGAD
jgi:TRAP-type C4-dicarboxylate transport system permease small subunit